MQNLLLTDLLIIKKYDLPSPAIHSPLTHVKVAHVVITLVDRIRRDYLNFLLKQDLPLSLKVTRPSHSWISVIANLIIHLGNKIPLITCMDTTLR